MVAARLSEEEREMLVSELSMALQQMLDSSCPDMVPLWLEATRAARSELAEPVADDVDRSGWDTLARLGRSARTKFKALAVFRHSAWWLGLRDDVEDPEFRGALDVVYFTRWPSNRPPYAWSSAANQAPGVDRFAGPNELKKLAKEGAWRVCAALRARRERWSHGGSWRDAHAMDLTKLGVGGSARDVLKLEDHPKFEEGR